MKQQLARDKSVIVLELPYGAEALRLARELAADSGGMVVLKDDDCTDLATVLPFDSVAQSE